MKLYLLLASFSWSISCSNKATPTTTVDPAPIEVLSTDSDQECPEGVKISCNVPDMTEKEMNTIYAANQQCMVECVQSRQAESISSDMIQQECQQGCDDLYFVGQVEMIPELESVEERSPNSTNSEETEKNPSE